MEFTTKYIPKGLSWRTLKPNENPFIEEWKLGPNDYPIHTSLFNEAGLRLPLWPVMVDFIRYTHTTLGQLKPNVVRIIGIINALIKSMGPT